MELRHLRYFVALAEQRHFGRAAESLNIAQPPLSQQIRALEEELQVTLFDRSRRPIDLTPAGRTLLREARQVLSQVDRARSMTRRAASGQAGRLIVGITGSAALEFAPPVLAAFSERLPDVNLSLREMSSPAQLIGLEKGEIHIGFVRPPVIDEHLSIRLVHQEPFVVALPASHPLAQEAALQLAALNGTPLVIFDTEEAPGFRELIMHLCQSGGYSPGKIQEAHQMTTMLCLVASGLGMALVPRSARRLAYEDVVFKPLLDDSPLVELYAVWPRDKAEPLIEELLAAVDDVRLAPLIEGRAEDEAPHGAGRREPV
ncbi:LysR family transcriptional regulator [Rhodoligotrophos defluvii]|uniref:LysR family transcriptional regulator n=1 Tax=Rhodoligotrophos defluvii TaxID=2561934 RepID=UPI0010C93E26|nr:LysR family transcriptional regulator [Rhodoligotrophos defluvii]